MISHEQDIVQAFLEMQKEFPFGKEYVENKLHKYIAITEKIMNEYPIGSKILSIGCGPCDVEAILSILGYKITAIDDLKDHWHLIGKNRDRIKIFAKKMDIELYENSADQVETGKSITNYFDVVLLIDILEHLHNGPRDLLNYSIATLKPNGLLIIETPNTVSLAKRLKVLFGKSNQVNANFIYWNFGKYRSHIREFTPSELIEILRYQQLVDINLAMINGLFDPETRTQHIIINIYNLLTSMYPLIKEAILISGKKPIDWQPNDISFSNLKRYYSHIEKYNLDNEPAEHIINNIIEMQ